jgi:hypothetical protein
MKHLKKFNESHVYLDEKRQLDIIEKYADCFMELSDINAFIYVDTFRVDINDMDEMKKKIDKLGTSFGTSELIIKIKGDDKWNSNGNRNRYHGNHHQSKLREIYEYLKQNLKNDEYRFSKIANVNIENLYTRIDVETAGTDYVNSFERDMKHPSIISSSYRSTNLGNHTGDIMTSYTIDPTNKPKHGIIRKIKSFLHGDKDYNFPDINPRDKITQIEIMHKITGL